MLDEIIAKQKSQEIKGKANDTNPKHKKRGPKHSKRNVTKKQKKMDTSGKAEHLSISKQKHLRFQDQRTENVSPNQKMTENAKPSQPANPHKSCTTPQLRKRPAPIPILRDPTRPNILIHNKSLAKDQGWYYKREDTTFCISQT